MGDTVINVLFLIGGLGGFLLGFRLLSNGIEKFAGSSLKKLFNKISNKKFIGLLIGIGVTAILQSSSATTVMVVGFVNSSIMSLLQATTIIMGANIGTTITGQIVALQDLPIIPIMISFVGIGVFAEMFLKNKGKYRYLADAFVGLGMVFLGLYFMKDSMDSIFTDNTQFAELLTSISNPVLLLLLGIGLTALLQSSSAVTAVLITLASAGVLVGGSGNGVLYVILGTNIGTCFTALLSSIGASQNAKRTSLIHVMFNVFGSLIFFIFLLLYQNFMQDTLAVWFKDNPSTQIAMFHTGFNVICALIFLPFSFVFVKLSQLIIRDKKVVIEEYETWLEKRFLQTPMIAIGQVEKVKNYMLALSFESLEEAVNAFINCDDHQNQKICDRNFKIVRINEVLTNYILSIENEGMNKKEENLISNVYYDLTDILRISDISDNILKYLNTRIKEELPFSEFGAKDINEIMDHIKELYLKIQVLSTKDKAETIEVLEEKIDKAKATSLSAHIERMKEGNCNPGSSTIFINLMSNLERVGDHLNFIALRVLKRK